MVLCNERVIFCNRALLYLIIKMIKECLYFVNINETYRSLQRKLQRYKHVIFQSFLKLLRRSRIISLISIFSTA